MLGTTWLCVNWSHELTIEDDIPKIHKACSGKSGSRI